MANYSELIATINEQIKANGNQEITGPVLNAVLQAMVSALGEGYKYIGLATPDTNPGIPDAKLFYFLTEPLDYPNFSSTIRVLGRGGLTLVTGSGDTENQNWSSFTIPIHSTRVTNIIGDGTTSLLKGKMSPTGLIPGNIYRFYLAGNNDSRPLADLNYTVFGIVIEYFDGTRISLGDYVNLIPCSDYPKFIDYRIPDDKNIRFCNVYARNLELNQPLDIEIEDITATVKQVKASRGSVNTDTHLLSSVGANNRAIFTLPIKRITSDVVIPLNFILPDGVSMSSNVYCYNDSNFVTVLNLSTNNKNTYLKVSAYLNVNRLYLVAKKDSALTDAEISSMCLWSDFDDIQDFEESVEMSEFMVSIPMVRGEMSYQGTDTGSLTNSTRVDKAISPMFVELEPNSEITDIDSSADIYYYDSDYRYLGNLKGAGKVPSVAKYMKIQIDASDSSLPTDIPNFTFKILAKKMPNIVKCTYYDVANGDRLKFVAYMVDDLMPDNVSATNNYQGDNMERIWNNGYILFPKTYTPTGKKTPLIFFFHGTGGYQFGETALGTYDEYLRFLSYCGFAVADCSVLTSKYTNQRDINVPNKIAFACYKNLYKHLINYYNVDEQVYFLSKSAGGMNSTIMAFLNSIPVRAIAGLAPSLDIYLNMRSITPAADINWCFDQLGIDITVSGNNPLSNGYGSYLSQAINDIPKLAGYNPMTFAAIGLDKETFYNELLTDSMNDFESNTNLVNAVNAASKISVPPIKIWHAVDDTAVPIASSRFFQKMIVNAGGLCFLREFPSGVGGHHAVDNAPNAPKTSYTTPLNGVKTIPVAYAEVVEWFKQW